MTREDIIKMAREAGVPVEITGGNPTKEQVLRFAALVAAAEREAVLKMLEDCLDYKTLIDVAEAIRARGET